MFSFFLKFCESNLLLLSLGGALTCRSKRRIFM